MGGRDLTLPNGCSVRDIASERCQWQYAREKVSGLDCWPPRAPTVNRPEPRHRKLLSLLGWVFSVENYWSHGGLLVYRDWWWPPFAPRAECFQLARLYQITPRVWRVGERELLVCRTINLGH